MFRVWAGAIAILWFALGTARAEQFADSLSRPTATQPILNYKFGESILSTPATRQQSSEGQAFETARLLTTNLANILPDLMTVPPDSTISPIAFIDSIERVNATRAASDDWNGHPIVANLPARPMTSPIVTPAGYALITAQRAR
jgi:hypothetical protein